MKLLIRFYENRILWLSIDSRKSFGVVRGKRVVVLIEDSAELGVINVGQTLDCLKKQLCQLIEEQLLNKECIYLIKFGSKACPRKPFPLPFIIKRSQYDLTIVILVNIISNIIIKQLINSII